MKGSLSPQEDFYKNVYNSCVHNDSNQKQFDCLWIDQLWHSNTMEFCGTMQGTVKLVQHARLSHMLSKRSPAERDRCHVTAWDESGRICKYLWGKCFKLASVGERWMRKELAGWQERFLPGSSWAGRCLCCSLDWVPVSAWCSSEKFT